MNLKEKLQAATKEAMKNKEVVKKETIIMLRAAILQVEKDSQKELTDVEMLTIVSKEVKKRKESLADFEKANRQDIIERIYEEIKILEEYMPEQLTESDIIKMVADAIVEAGADGTKDMGKVMAVLKDKTAGKADGKIVSTIVREELMKL